MVFVPMGGIIASIAAMNTWNAVWEDAERRRKEAERIEREQEKSREKQKSIY